MKTLVVGFVKKGSFAATVALGLWACSTPNAQQTQTTAAVQPEYSGEGKLSMLRSDSDGDGKIDTWGFMDGARVVRVEIDENADGRADRIEYHSEAATAGGAPALGPDKTIERIERSTNRDGKFNRKEFFENGLLVRVEEDRDGDGKIDKWETYEDGALRLLALDTTHRGTPDRRMVYGADGNFLRVETDPKGTGTFTPLHQ